MPSAEVVAHVLDTSTRYVRWPPTRSSPRLLLARQAGVQASAAAVVVGLAQGKAVSAPPFSLTQLASWARVPNPSLA